jgi:hypothetical protein
MIYSNLFDEILAKPAFFVGNCNIQHIYFFMKGYIDANWQNGNQDTSDLYFGFQNWVAKRCCVSVTINWAKVITLFSSSEIHAFERTSELWSEYKTEVKQL